LARSRSRSIFFLSLAQLVFLGIVVLSRDDTTQTWRKSKYVIIFSMKTLFEILGWYGTVAILAAYALVSFSIISPDNVWYQILNGTGAVGIVVVSYYKRAYQPAVLNLVWAGIALVALIRYFI
jgi:hypothetical protein